MTWEEAPISNDTPFLYKVNKEMDLKYYSISLNREMHEMGKHKFSEGTLSYSASLIIGGHDVFLPFLREDRATKEEMKRDPDFPYYQTHMTFLGLNNRTDSAVYYNFDYSEYRNTPYFTITANHERAQKYFDIIADAHFSSQQIIINRYKNDTPPAQHRCTAFIYICPETGKEFIKRNPYL